MPTDELLQLEITKGCEKLSEFDRMSKEAKNYPRQESKTPLSKRLDSLIGTLELFLENATFNDAIFDKYQQDLKDEFSVIEKQIRDSDSKQLIGRLAYGKALKQTMKEVLLAVKEFDTSKYPHLDLFRLFTTLTSRPVSLQMRISTTALSNTKSRDHLIRSWQSVILKTQKAIDTKSLSNGARSLFEKSIERVSKLDDIISRPMIWFR